MQQVFRLTKYFGHIIYLFRIYLFICPGISYVKSFTSCNDLSFSVSTDVWCDFNIRKKILEMAVKKEDTKRCPLIYFASGINSFCPIRNTSGEGSCS